MESAKIAQLETPGGYSKMSFTTNVSLGELELTLNVMIEPHAVVLDFASFHSELHETVNRIATDAAECAHSLHGYLTTLLEPKFVSVQVSYKIGTKLVSITAKTEKKKKKGKPEVPMIANTPARESNYDGSSPQMEENGSPDDSSVAGSPKKYKKQKTIF